MAYQGKYKPINESKYVGDTKDVVYRSSWEYKLYSYFDNNPNVVNWSSESVVIPYKSPVDKRIHRYFVDAWARFKRPTGEHVEYLIEVKPNAQKHPPDPSTSKLHPRRYKKALITYAINQAKWEAAKSVALAKGWKFVVMDEYDLGIKKRSMIDRQRMIADGN